MGLLDKALVDLSQAVENNPYDYVSYLYIGHIHLFETGQPDEALGANREAERLALTISNSFAARS